MLVPLATALSYYWLFKYVAKIKVEDYSLFLITGLLPWTFFTQNIVDGMDAITNNHSLMCKIPVQFHVFTLSCSITNFVNFLFALPVIFGFVLCYF